MGEQAALDQLRHGSIKTAVTTYRQQGRLVTADTTGQVREQLVADWWRTHQTDPAESVMIALRRADVADLNRRARTRLAATGRLTGPTLDVGGLPFQAGDRILCLRNRQSDGLVNGLRATITGVRDNEGLDIVTDHGQPLRVPAGYLAAGHLDHGYALTGHKAQGLTVDHAYVLGSDALYREWGYVAMSRGRHTNRLYTHALPDREPDAHRRTPRVDPIATTARRLGRSHAEQPVSDQTLDKTAARWRKLTRWLDSDDIREQPNVDARLQDTIRRRQANAGQLTELTEQAASWVGPAWRSTTRRHRTHVRRRIHRLSTRVHRLDTDIAHLQHRLAGMPTTQRIATARRERDRLDDLLTHHARSRADAALTTPPGHLVVALGSPPSDPPGRVRWQRAAHLIERYRLDWSITHPRLPLGMTPTNLTQVRARQHLTTELDRLTPPRESRQIHRGARGLAR